MVNQQDFNTESPALEADPTHDVARGTAPGLRLLGYTLLYIGECIESDLQDIASQSSRNNPRDNVTGVLLFDAGRFIQVVEGPDESIGRLVARISRDLRGSEMHILFDTPIRVRSMDRWDLWVGRLDCHKPIATDDIERFREMYERSLLLEAHGFITLLLKLIEEHGAFFMEKSP